MRAEQDDPPAAPSRGGIGAGRVAIVLLASLALHALVLLAVVLWPHAPQRSAGSVAVDVQLLAPARTPVNTPAALAATDAGTTPAPLAKPQETLMASGDVAAAPVAAVTRHDDTAIATETVSPDGNTGAQPTQYGLAAPASGAATTSQDNAASAANPAQTRLSGAELALLCPHRQPAYPETSRQRGERGRVELNLHIGRDGRVNSAWVRTSSGIPRLDRAAIAEVMSWQCNPAQRDGVAVEALAVQAFSFALEK